MLHFVTLTLFAAWATPVTPSLTSRILPKISQGSISSSGQFPSTVQVHVRNGVNSTKCGGSILGPNIVITAAHCTSDLQILDESRGHWVKIIAGSNHWNLASGTHQIRTAFRILTYPSHNNTTLKHDLAILVLSQALEFGPTIQPIRIPEYGQAFQGTAIIAGWGRMSHDSISVIDLRHAVIPILDGVSCWLHFNHYSSPIRFLNRSMICAGGNRSETCKGDSGGPLICTSNSGAEQYLCGVTSWGAPCTSGSVPSVFTRVSAYSSWIDNILQAYNGSFASPDPHDCGNGRNVSRHWLCDGDNDCGDGSDELGCSSATEVSSGLVSNSSNHIALYRPGTGTFWIQQHGSGNQFKPVYAQGDPGHGIGGYDLRSPDDRAFSFDYDHSGRQNHLVLYRPGTGTVWILTNSGGSFSRVYGEGDPGRGIGGYDLRSKADRGFAFDWDSSGRLDHLVFYRPGTGTMWILKNEGGSFRSVYAQGDPGNGVGDYDLRHPGDRAFAFDYEGSGKCDHLVLYRPGLRVIYILRRSGSTFYPVFQSHGGVGGYDLASPADRMFAFDYTGSGRLNHLFLYRPGTGTIWILRRSGQAFVPVYAEGDPGRGIGGYDLRSVDDRAFGLDYDKSGRPDHIALYRPGTGTMWILKNEDGRFRAVYAQGDPGNGIGGYDLRSKADRAFAFDYAA